MTRRGMAIYATSVDNDWPSLLALQPGALCVIDPYHLPRALPPAEEQYWLWRPWVPGTMREHTPYQWLQQVRSEWAVKGERPFHGIQFLNEPNLAGESGYPQGSREAAQAAVEWGLRAVDLIRETWGADIDVHSPPLSPNVPGWEDFYCWMELLIEACDVLNVHTYLDNPRSYEEPHRLYPQWPLVISECGDRGNGTAEYGRALQHWLDWLPDYVEWATAFVYNSTGGQYPEWELTGTEAERELIEAGV